MEGRMFTLDHSFWSSHHFCEASVLFCTNFSFNGRSIAWIITSSDILLPYPPGLFLDIRVWVIVSHIPFLSRLDQDVSKRQNDDPSRGLDCLYRLDRIERIVSRKQPVEVRMLAKPFWVGERSLNLKVSSDMLAVLY
jgi:hypothetical protein